MSSLDHKMFETLYIHFVLDNLVSHKQRTWHRDRIHHVDMQSVELKGNLCSPAQVTEYIYRLDAESVEIRDLESRGP